MAPSLHRDPRRARLALACAGVLFLGVVAPAAGAEEAVRAPGETVTGLVAGENGGRVCPLDRTPLEGEPAGGGRRTDPVVDGDTVRLRGLDATVRLLAVDTEETYRHDREEDEAKRDFSAYSDTRRGDSPRPVKYGTPAGMNAKVFAREFFEGVDEVLLLPDDPARQKGYFGRYLGYLLVDRDGDGGFEQNYNVELVRAGHSPYFIKYGRSRLFDEEFQAAEKVARDAGVGVWEEPAKPGNEHYPDYEERLAWWRERAEAIEHFAKAHGEDDAFIMMGQEGALDILRQRVGGEVTLFGSVSVREDPADGRTWGFVSHMNRMDVPVCCEDEAVWQQLAIGEHTGDLIYIRGRIGQAMTDRYRAGVELRLDEESRVWREPTSKPERKE